MGHPKFSGLKQWFIHFQNSVGWQSGSLFFWSHHSSMVIWWFDWGHWCCRWGPSSTIWTLSPQEATLEFLIDDDLGVLRVWVEAKRPLEKITQYVFCPLLLVKGSLETISNSRRQKNRSRHLMGLAATSQGTKVWPQGGVMPGAIIIVITAPLVVRWGRGRIQRPLTYSHLWSSDRLT